MCPHFFARILTPFPSRCFFFGGIKPRKAPNSFQDPWGSETWRFGRRFHLQFRMPPGAETLRFPTKNCSKPLTGWKIHPESVDVFPTNKVLPTAIFRCHVSFQAFRGCKINDRFQFVTFRSPKNTWRSRFTTSEKVIDNHPIPKIDGSRERWAMATLNLRLRFQELLIGSGSVPPTNSKPQLKMDLNGWFGDDPFSWGIWPIFRYVRFGGG